MRIIVHIEDPADMAYAQNFVLTSIAEGYDQCAYTRGDVSGFVYRNKTGWTVRVQRGGPPTDTTGEKRG